MSRRPIAPTLVLVLVLLGLRAASSEAQEPGVPQLWTVVVSVEGYPSPIPSRPGLNANARKLAGWVSRTAGWGSDHVLELNDLGDPRPGPPSSLARPLRSTAENLDWAIDRWLGHRVKAGRGDVVLLAFAGRGMATPAGEVLLPIDARIGAPGWSPEKGVERLLRDYQCSSVISWIDAPMLGPDARPRPEGGDQFMGRLARWPGSSVWMASGESLEGQDHVFLESIRTHLGDGRNPLLALLSAVDGDPRVRALRFRQMGGVPPDLSLARDRFHVLQKARAELLVQKGHAGKVVAVAIQGDGRAVFTASEDSTIRVWNPSSRLRSLVRVLPEFLNGVTALALGLDGRHLIGGDGMGEVLAWEVSGADPRPIASTSPRLHDARIKALAYLPGGPSPAPGKPPASRFLSVGQDGLAVVWDVIGRELSQRLVAMPRVRDLKLAAASRPGGPSAFVLIGEDGILRVFDRDARSIRTLPPIPRGRPTALEIDAEGRWAFVGDQAGLVRVADLASGATRSERPPAPGPISSIRVGPGKLLAIGDSQGLSLTSIDHPETAHRLVSGTEPVESVEFSADGGWLAARTRMGNLQVWKLEEGRDPSKVVLDPAAGGCPGVASLGFGPASSPPMLVVGESDGGIRRWDLTTLRESPRIDPHRGMVRRIGATIDGRHLLQITSDHLAQVWDLQAGRSVQTLEGTWVTGAFLPDGRLAMVRHPDAGGGVAVVDPREGRMVVGGELVGPVDGPLEFDRLAVSRDGRRVAASSTPGRDEAVLVWDLPGGGPPRSLPSPHTAPLTALDFSEDGQTLLTAGEDGFVRLWDLAAREGLKAPVAEYRAPRVDTITAARLAPGGARRVIAAGRTPDDKGVVVYWDGKSNPKEVRPRALRLGEFAGKVLAVTFVKDGRYVAAAGRGRRLRIWDLQGSRGPEELAVDVTPGRGSSTLFAPHHSEAINDLMAWPRPDGPALISGSDDTTVRFWRVEPALAPGKATLQLLGTLTSAPEATPLTIGKGDPSKAESPWVAFTPDGVYDASVPGENLVSFGDGRVVAPVDQFAPRLFSPLLTDQIRRGVPTPPRIYKTPPPLLIEAPEVLGPDQADAEIKVSIGDRTLKSDRLRLYQNDVPIRDGSGFVETSSGEYLARVRLVRGDNRLYAMAGRPDDVDARSRDLILYHAGEDRPGRLHVISLGIGDYLRNALRFPVADAEQFARYIQSHGVGAGKTPGVRVLLADKEISTRRVQDEFAKVREAVQGHPEDTVVVFLAGHTDLLAAPDGTPRYSLLLPSFPFPEADPAQAVLRGPGVAAATRSAPEGTYLPYSTIYRNLAAMDALQRLVIVDACQAESVLDDPSVRTLEQLKAMERETRESRTNYFLASRKGEAAEESAELKHGLLTYVMLRGMGASDLEALPVDIPELRDRPNADTNGDGTVTTRELHRYVLQTLPRLADQLPGRLRGPQTPQPNPLAARSRMLDSPKVEASVPSFPLVRLSNSP